MEYGGQWGYIGHFGGGQLNVTIKTFGAFVLVKWFATALGNDSAVTG